MDWFDTLFDASSLLTEGSRIFRQPTLCRRRPSRAQRCPAERRRALCDRVQVIEQFGGEFVEKLVQLEELRPFHVPVSLFGLAVKVERVGSGRVSSFVVI